MTESAWAVITQEQEATSFEKVITAFSGSCFELYSTYTLCFTLQETYLVTTHAKRQC